MRATAAASPAAACASATSTCSASMRGSCARCAATPCPYIAQSAAASFNPSRTILDQVVEPVGAARHAAAAPKPSSRRSRCSASWRCRSPRPSAQRYPHQVSGGQLQRLMAAMALITDPEVVILDEPTTALDVTTQIEVLRAFRRVVRERQVTAVYVSHDLAVVAQMADHILVLRDGQHARAGQHRAAARSAGERLHAEPARRGAPGRARRTARPEANADLLLEVRGLIAGYGAHGRERPAGDDDRSRTSTCSCKRGQAIGVIGESGSGKTTLARVCRRAARALRRHDASSTASELTPTLARAQPRRAAPHPDRLPVGRHGAQSVADHREHPRAAAAVLPRAEGRGR